MKNGGTVTIRHTFPDEVRLPTRKVAQGVNIYLVAYQVDQARYCASGSAGLMSGRKKRTTVEPFRRWMHAIRASKMRRGSH